MISLKNLHGTNMNIHLNVFWQYDGNPGHENNITKALINTFESLDEQSKKVFVEKLFNIDIPDGEVSYQLYLQSSPPEDEIRNIPDSNKLLFAFSPTGKTWGAVGIAEGETGKIEESIRKSLREYYVDLPDDEFNRLLDSQFEETKSIIENKGGSIPDAWIMIYCSEATYCIAMENKLYDLDPYQLNNHCEKSLRMKEKRIVYAMYSDIIEILGELKGYLINDFLVSMYFLNFWSITNLEQLKGTDVRRNEYYCRERCRQILHEISCGKEVTRHRGWMYSFPTGNDFNREIGMNYDPISRKFYIPLYFGSTQSTAREMYKIFSEREYKLDGRFIYEHTFHMQQKGNRRNVPETRYIHSDLKIEDYMRFWTEHTDFIWQSDAQKRGLLLKEMLEADIIPKDDYKRMIEYSNNYGKPLNIIPEFGVRLEWTYDEALELDKEHRFVYDIKTAINDVYDMFNIDRLFLDV